MHYEDNHFIDSAKAVWNFSLFDENIIDAYQEGGLKNAYDYFGSHPLIVLNKNGYYFSVWAPNAKMVSVVGDFNQWNNNSHQLFVRLDHSGIWEGFIPDLPKGSLYKFHIVSNQGKAFYKADPYARYSELRPATASLTWKFSYKWGDKKWMNKRKNKNSLNAPWNVYEIHLGSWMRPNKNDESSFNSYRQIAELLIPYVKEMNFTHVEFMPITEFPYDASWGYQCTGYFSATSRFGTSDDLMFLIDMLHQNDIGVILDWVPSHFPSDAHGLYFFDGAHTYEYADNRKGFHPDWNSYIFNYKRGEVQSFLLSSAHFWMKHFHIDGLRVDAVNSMIRLDYSRKKGQWVPNEFGTNENLEAIDFLKKLNQTLYYDFPNTQSIAEEASDWPGITIPVSQGGFGFGMKWMMGWMHDTFKYFKTPHQKRKQIQDVFSFSMMYFYDEKFMLPLSHDEVVHGKSPMIYKMPGMEWEKFANLRLLYTYMYTHPGTKLMFMGNEFGQTSEWNDKSEIDWHLLQHISHSKLKDCVKKLGQLYLTENALYFHQFESKGFEWIELGKKKEGVIAFKRKGKNVKDDLIVIMNIDNQYYPHWEMIVQGKLNWLEIFNSNDVDYWGTGIGLNENPKITLLNKKQKICKIEFQIPPLSAMIFK